MKFAALALSGLAAATLANGAALEPQCVFGTVVTFGPGGEVPPPAYDLHFRLVDDAGEPLAGETGQVKFGGKIKTDDEGYFIVRGAGAPNGKVTLTLDSDGSEIAGVPSGTQCLTLKSSNCATPGPGLNYVFESNYYAGSVEASLGCGFVALSLNAGSQTLTFGANEEFTFNPQLQGAAPAPSCITNVLTLGPDGGAQFEDVCGQSLSARSLILPSHMSQADSSVSAQAAASTQSCTTSQAAAAGVSSAATLAAVGLVGAGVYLVKRQQDKAYTERV